MSQPSRRRTGRPPLVSACLIVKDEEAVIARAIESVLPLVDEVVVHDTGSTDRTVEICESLGARVIRGSWRDDFAWARNVAIEAARGRWVLVLDADEELMPTNVRGLRQLLSDGALDAYRAQVNNAADVAGNISVSHSSIRLFRRKEFRYAGRIHEQVVSVASRRVTVDSGEIIELTHWGYLPTVMQAKDKANRNIHLAEVSNEEQQTEKSILETARARSLGNDVAGTLERVVMIRDAADGEIRYQALQLGVQMHVRAGDVAAARDWLDDLLAFGRPNGLTTYLHGYVLMLEGRLEEAVEVFGTEHDHAASMAHGVTHSTAASRAMVARCLTALGREEEGLAVYLEVAADGPLEMWPELLRVLYMRGEMHRAVPAFAQREDVATTGRRLRATLAMLVSCPIEVGDAFAEVLYVAEPGDVHALAFISMVADRLDPERAFIWSTRARDAGLAQSCPLLRQVDELSLPPVRRLTAAAVLLQAFADPRAVDGLTRAARDLADEEVLEALYVVGELAPGALEPFVMGVVSSQPRALVMAEALAALHAEEQAADVLRVGLELHPASQEWTPQLESRLGELDPALDVGGTVGAA